MGLRDILEPEVLEFRIPYSSSHVLYIPDINWSRGEDLLVEILSEHFGQFGLINQVTVNQDTENACYYSYIRYYSSRATIWARLSSRGGVSLKEGVTVRVAGHAQATSACPASRLPLARYKCEELANFYLGFNGWSSKVLYHRQEDTDPTLVKYVTVVKLEFGKDGLNCEGAGMVEVEVEGESPGHKLKAIVEAAKRSKGEAIQAAWSKVVMVVIGQKVLVEINTTKKDAFFYDPLWEDLVVKVHEADYDIYQQEENVNDLIGEWSI